MSLRQNILDSLEELKNSNLESEQARQVIADRIISKHAKEVIAILGAVDESINKMNSIFRKNAAAIIH